MRNRRRFLSRLSLLLCGALSLALSACRQEPPPIPLTVPTGEEVPLASPPRDALHFGIGAMLTPQEGYRYYLDLITWLERKTGLSIRVLEKSSYAEVNEALRTGEIDVSFVCSGPYVTGREQFGLDLLLQPQAYGQKVYYSYIIVPAGSPAKSLADLRGRVFAFTDPGSNTGCLVPTFLLAKEQGAKPEEFFSRVLFTGTHDRAVEAVADKLADGAAVDSLIYEYLQGTRPDLTRQITILRRSQPFAIPPLVARPGLDPAVRRKIMAALLSMDQDPEGRRILEGMKIERFHPGDDKAFDSIREMQSWLARRK